MAKLIDVVLGRCLDCPYAVKGMAAMGCRNKDKKGVVQALIKDVHSIPSFCPLPDAPASRAKEGWSPATPEKKEEPKAEEPKEDAPEVPAEEPKAEEATGVTDEPQPLPGSPPKTEKKKAGKKGKKK